MADPTERPDLKGNILSIHPITNPDWCAVPYTEQMQHTFLAHPHAGKCRTLPRRVHPNYERDLRPKADQIEDPLERLQFWIEARRLFLTEEQWEHVEVFSSAAAVIDMWPDLPRATDDRKQYATFKKIEAEIEAMRDVVQIPDAPAVAPLIESSHDSGGGLDELDSQFLIKGAWTPQKFDYFDRHIYHNRTGSEAFDYYIELCEVAEIEPCLRYASPSSLAKTRNEAHKRRRKPKGVPL